MPDYPLRANEMAVDVPSNADAQIYFIGRILTPWKNRSECPRQGSHDGPLCQIEVDSLWQPALSGLETFAHVEVLYWLNQSRRDLLLQSPKANGETFGTFALRSPVRPNPIGTSIVLLEKVQAGILHVRGLDCLCGTPLVDLKPARHAFKVQAPPKSF